MSDRAALARRDLYREPLIDGRPARMGAWAGARRRLAALRVSRDERTEAELERRLRGHRGVTRANTVAVLGPKGGVGKTTTAFVVGNVLAGHLNLRAVAVDTNPDFGTLAALAPECARVERSLADLLDDLDDVQMAAELRPYVARLPTGLHLLAAPRDPERMAALGPERYGELLAFLAFHYEVVLLDVGTGITGSVARFALGRADQVLLVTTPGWVTALAVLGALEHVRHQRTTVVVNRSRPGDRTQPSVLEERLRERRLHRLVGVPDDEQLAVMLDAGTYSLEALERPTRLAVKQLALGVAERLG